MLNVVPINGQTWLICGGRDFADKAMFDDAMSQLLGHFGCPRKVVHGGAKGADTLADEWAKRLAIDVVAVPADWSAHGRAAGPLRNKQMLVEHSPNLVIAFPGGKGTENMIARARMFDISIVEIKPVAQEASERERVEG